MTRGPFETRRQGDKEQCNSSPCLPLSPSPCLSLCVYRDMRPGEPELTEDDAIPANPDNEYGWEKLYAERVAQAYGRRYGMQVRIVRFENCYGPEGTHSLRSVQAWTGGREKAPAAICRKVAEAENGGIIEVWGDGTAI